MNVFKSYKQCCMLFMILVISEGLIHTAWAQTPELRPLNVYSNPRRLNAEFWWRVDIEKNPPNTEEEKKQTPRFGKASSPALYVWLSQPKSWEEQWASEARWLNSRPQWTYLDPDNSNLIQVWQKSEIAMGDSLIIHKRFTITSFEVTYTIDPQMVGNYNKSSYLFRQYTKSESGIDKSGEIRKLARMVVGEEKNPYLRARLLFGWIILNISYSDETQIYSAVRTLENGIGNGANYAILFVALCRSLDIPARIVSGHWTSSNRGLHIWTEFYLPNYGWIPADPAEADYDNPTTVSNDLYKKYFGHLDNKSIIISKGMNVFLWPNIRGKWLRDFGLSSDGRSPMMQIGDYVIDGLNALSDYKYTWNFWE